MTPPATSIATTRTDFSPGPADALAREGGLRNTKNELAAQVTSFTHPMCVGGLCQRVFRDLRQGHETLHDERSDAVEVRSVAVHPGPQGSDIWAVRRERFWARRGAGKAATGTEYEEALLRHLASDGIEHRIDTIHQLDEILRTVVDDLISAELARIFVILRARRGDHVRAEMLREADGEARDAACALSLLKSPYGVRKPGNRGRSERRPNPRQPVVDALSPESANLGAGQDVVLMHDGPADVSLEQPKMLDAQRREAHRAQREKTARRSWPPDAR
jgi:hypothetical protein